MLNEIKGSKFYAALTGAVGFTLVHFAKSAIGKVIPESAIANANANFKPSMYAMRIPGRSAAENTSLSCVAPVATTKAGLTPGTVIGTCVRSRFAKAV